MFGEYKLMAYGIIGILLVVIGTTAVFSYNHYVSKAAQQEDLIKAKDKQIKEQQDIVAEQTKQIGQLKQYQRATDQRRIVAENRIKQILSMESKRDEKGNITADDPIVNALNGMYPRDQDDKDPADHPPSAAMPESKDVTGKVDRRKDVLPK